MKRLLLCLGAALLIVACGKKGNPLPPLQRIPAAPADFTVTRIDDEAYVRFVVPGTNIDGGQPADIAGVELYGITLEQPPHVLADLPPEELREAATLVASVPVRRPLPPPPPGSDGRSLPPLPQPPGAEQGSVVVLTERLTPQVRTAVTLPGTPEPGTDASAEGAAPRPFSAPAAGAGLQRHYFAVAVSTRGRHGPHSAVVPVPLGGTSGPPSQPVIDVDETSLTLRWTPPRDARGTVAPQDPDLLPSRPIVPPPPPTTYDVYEVPRNVGPDAPPQVPTPLTPEPIAATEFVLSGITLGVERCFYVRAVDIVEGIHVRGPASPVQCASLADVFPPPAPGELVAVAVPGGVNLIWEPSEAPDLAGYLVLRGEIGSATLTPLTSAPVTVPSYRDEAVTSGTRYVYAVVAVDRAGNRSAESNRVEETAQ